MAIGKITGSVVADNTLTESNLAFGISGQSAATAWATDTLKVNIIESDDSSGIQLNDSLNISGTLSANTIDVNTLTSGDSSGININDTALYVNGDRVATVTGTETLTNKTIDTANNTITITESDISDLGAYITASSTDTLTNKTFDANGTGNSLSNVEVADFAASAVVLESEGIGSNDNDTTLPTSAAVKNYVDAGTATFTNKTFDANGTGNSISNIETADFASGVVDIDLSSVSASDNTIASAKAIKAYVDSVSGGSLALGDDASNAGVVNINAGEDLVFHSGNSITLTAGGNGVTAALNDAIVVNAISSADSTAIQINDGVNVSGTLSANTIDVNSLTSSDSSGINIDEAKLYVNGASVLTAGSGGDVERTTSTAQITDVLINNSGTVFRIPLANIDISSFNNDAGFASGGVSGFSASTVTSFPVELGDSAARDYGDGEPGGVGTGTSENTDPFGVALGTTFDAMEPNGSVQTTDLGSEEAHVGV